MQASHFRGRFIQRVVKPTAEQLGLLDLLRTAYVEGNMLGERLVFSIRGRPSPSSAMLLVGSGRSGTTWLSDILTNGTRIQQIFEPLSPEWNREIRRLSEHDARSRFPSCRYLRAIDDDPEWTDLLERILTGRVRNYWTDAERTSYFPTRFLIKMIRANLMLGYIYDRFRPHIVYLIRHPCAVIHSRISVGWQADVRDLLRQEPLVEDHLRPWLGMIEHERDPVGTHAVWWAVENAVAMRDLATRPHRLLRYEEAFLDPHGCVHDLCAWLGVETGGKLHEIIRRPSRMSRKIPVTASATARLESWKCALSADASRRILDWAHRFGISDYADATT